MKSLRLNFLIFILFGIFCFLQYRLWFEEGSVNDIFAMKKNLAVQAKQNEKIKKRNDELMFQVQRLKNSPDATESRARNELGMIKQDETFYQVVK